MQKYNSYKETGIDWIGDIPVDWHTVSLKWISNIYSGGTPSKNKPEYWTNGTIPWLNSGTVNQWDISKASEYITEEALENSSAKWIKEKAILIALAGQGKTKGMVGQLQFKATCNQSLGVIDPFSSELKRYLLYWLHNNYQNIRNLGGGDKRDGINLEMIGTIPVPLPTKSEQTQIANYLDRKTTEIDQLIADKKALVELYKEEKTAIINQAVTKGINPYAKMKDSGIEWLGQVPEHWEVKRIKNICKVRQGLQIPIDKRLMTFEEGSFEYITIRSINNPKDAKQYILNPAENVICTKDDVLMARTGATGIPIIDVEGVFHNNFFLIDYDRNKVERMYLYYFLKSSLIYEYLLLVAGTTTIPDLNHGAFYSTPFFTIGKEEQTQIVKFIETEFCKVDKKIVKAEKYISLLNEYRTALISEVVTGKIKVTEA